MYTLEGRLKEREKMFLIAIFCISGYETPVLNVICLLNELYYILGKYVEVFVMKPQEKSKTKQNCMHPLNFTISQNTYIFT